MRPMHSRLRLLWVFITASFVALASLAIAAETAQVCADKSAIGVPDWIRQAVIYEINVRQYSASGKFTAVTADLPRIKALGVDVLWLMPINPIGEQNRKGPLGSYYAVRDYAAVNPEYGTEAEFKQLVDAAHAQGFRVILDWVGNHTAWDNPLTKEHPDYYVHDAKGQFTPPTGFDWTDVIQLDFKNPAVLDYQANVMAHWIRDFGIDGFRCDFATGVPTVFWNELFARLRAIRPDLFCLAESELPQHQLKAFNASYSFDLMKAYNDVATGGAEVSKIDDTLAAIHTQFPAGGVLINYTTNHDENSWNGTTCERLGGGVKAFAVLTFMLDGIPLIYDGQEVGLDRRLAFFEHDPIVWHESPYTAFYQKLCQLRHEQAALRTGAAMRRINTTHNESLYIVLRESGASRVLALLNLTSRDVPAADAYDPELAGTWRDAFTGEQMKFGAAVPVTLHSWQYRVLVHTE